MTIVKFAFAACSMIARLVPEYICAARKYTYPERDAQPVRDDADCSHRE